MASSRSGSGFACCSLCPVVHRSPSPGHGREKDPKSRDVLAWHGRDRGRVGERVPVCRLLLLRAGRMGERFRQTVDASLFINRLLLLQLQLMFRSHIGECATWNLEADSRVSSPWIWEWSARKKSRDSWGRNRGRHKCQLRNASTSNHKELSSQFKVNVAALVAQSNKECKP